MVDIPSDAYSSPPSDDDPDEILLKMDWLRMESDLPSLNSQGEQILDEIGQIRLTGQSLVCVFNRTGGCIICAYDAQLVGGTTGIVHTQQAIVARGENLEMHNLP
ncbi:hypothetical protein AgCh_000716 [Apium graveolens]